MKTLTTILLGLAVLAGGLTVFAQLDTFGHLDGNKADSAYKKAKIKNRANLQAKRETDNIAGTKYVYVDDEEIDESIEEQEEGETNEFSIGSVTLEKGTRLREVSIFIDSKKKKELEVESQGGEEGTKVDVGHVKVEKGAKVKKVTSIIEMELDIKDK